MKKKIAQRNGLVDVMRLGFAGIVMMYHFYSGGKKHFHGGFLGVEYFMILAGFLLFSAWNQRCASMQRMEERLGYWMSYMKKRYVRFFWYSLIAFAFAFLVSRVYYGGIRTPGQLADRLSGDIWEILLVKMNGLNQGASLLNGPAWTLSSMLVAEFFVLGMVTFWERPFLSFLMPLSIICGTGYWMNAESIDLKIFHTFFTFGTLRVYILTCCGIFSYWICKRLKAISFSSAGRWTLTAIELAGYVACVLITFYRSTRYYQFCFMLIATVVLAVSFSGKSFAGSILPANRFTNFCAEYSLGLYLTHRTILRFFQYEDINDTYRQKFVFLLCALAAALIYTFIMRGVFKMLPIMRRRLKSILTEEG